MKAISDYYAEMFNAFLDTITCGTATGVDMAVLSVMMLYEGEM